MALLAPSMAAYWLWQRTHTHVLMIEDAGALTDGSSVLRAGLPIGVVRRVTRAANRDVVILRRFPFAELNSNDVAWVSAGGSGTSAAVQVFRSCVSDSTQAHSLTQGDTIAGITRLESVALEARCSELARRIEGGLSR